MEGRHERLERLIGLVLRLRATSAGLTSDELAERFEVSRRTVQRMLGVVRRVFPELESRRTEDGRHLWRLPSPRTADLVSLDSDEVEALELATHLIARDGLPGHAEALRRLAAKVRAIAPIATAGRLETDVDAMLQCEGLAMRPGPRPQTDPSVSALLRQALLACREVVVDYRPLVGQRSGRYRLRPYGLVLGNLPSLVAYDVAREGIALFALSDIAKVTLTEHWFERPDDFDLRAFTERSFGVYQGEVYDVAWRISPEWAPVARSFEFHPTQRLEEQPDGSVIVRFRASGLSEMAWHLFVWRDQVQILEPEALREELVAMLEHALAAHRRGG